MLVKIGVSFSAKEARELVGEISSLTDELGTLEVEWPVLSKLKKRLESPLTPDKIPAVVENNDGN